MKILLVHNFYKTRGGEDQVLSNEETLLSEGGHDVSMLTLSNESIIGKLSAFFTVFGTVFSIKNYFLIKSKIKLLKPDVVHVHNFFPLISPSVFYACKRMNTPVVLTLHNYRTICPTSLLMLDGTVTEKSIFKGPWWAVRKRVYRDSLIGTLVICIMISLHKRLGTWRNCVSAYICLTEFSRDIYVRAGWPKAKLYVKPNFLPEPIHIEDNLGNEEYVLFVGRLSEEKGITLLIEAWQQMNTKLVVVGDGPLANLFEKPINNIQYIGLQPKERVLSLMKKAKFLVMTSTWYEGLPMVLVEAFANGTCALVPQLGGMAEVVEHNVTGKHYISGDIESFVSNAKYLLANSETCKKYSENARIQYEKCYSPEDNLRQLVSIYERLSV